MIPRHIFSVWLNDDRTLPPLMQKCVASQQLPGYTYHQVTLDNLETDSRYVREAIAAKKWVKAADYVRMDYLYRYGGVYLDSDMEILVGHSFDDMLAGPMWVCQESNGVYANSALGVEANHPLLAEYLRRVEENFRGDGDLVFEPGLRAFADLIWTQKYGKIHVYAPEVFFPFNHETGETILTDRTRAIHHFARTWIKQ